MVSFGSCDHSNPTQWPKQTSKSRVNFSGTVTAPRQVRWLSVWCRSSLNHGPSRSCWWWPFVVACPQVFQQTDSPDVAWFCPEHTSGVDLIESTDDATGLQHSRDAQESSHYLMLMILQMSWGILSAACFSVYMHKFSTRHRPRVSITGGWVSWSDQSSATLVILHKYNIRLSCSQVSHGT